MEAGLVVVAMMTLGVLALGALIWGIIAAIQHQQRLAAERRALVAGWAHHREWDYLPVDPGLVSRFHGAPFGQGSSREATNVVRGQHDGRHFVAFDYKYVTRSSESSTTHRYSVCALNLGVTAPELSVGPTGFLGRIANKLLGNDIPIGDSAFDHAYTVTSQSPEFARDVLHPGVLELMSHHPGIAWRITGDSLVVLRTGQHTPDEVEGKLLFMDAVLDRVPQHAWDRLHADPNAR